MAVQKRLCSSSSSGTWHGSARLGSAASPAAWLPVWGDGGGGGRAGRYTWKTSGRLCSACLKSFALIPPGEVAGPPPPCSLQGPLKPPRPPAALLFAQICFPAATMERLSFKESFHHSHTHKRHPAALNHLQFALQSHTVSVHVYDCCFFCFFF